MVANYLDFLPFDPLSLLCCLQSRPVDVRLDMAAVV